MTKIINLYGGPGTGKSTFAAYGYAKMKSAGVNAELVREYVKDWAWEDRAISTFDQLYFLGKQIRRETLVYNRVDVIITDSPVSLPILYAATAWKASITAVVKEFYRFCEEAGHQHHHVFLERGSRPYNPAGRWQSEGQARLIDEQTWSLLEDLFGGSDVVPASEEGMDMYLKHIKVV
jgi:hypothetical protein